MEGPADCGIETGTGPREFANASDAGSPFKTSEQRTIVDAKAVPAKWHCNMPACGWMPTIGSATQLTCSALANPLARDRATRRARPIPAKRKAASTKPPTPRKRISSRQQHIRTREPVSARLSNPSRPRDGRLLVAPPSLRANQLKRA